MDDKNLVCLGPKLLELRQAAGLSQRELSRRSGVNQSVISKIEANAVHYIRAIDVARLEHGLGVSAGELYFVYCQRVAKEKEESK